jgi:hypothetical protein
MTQATVVRYQTTPEGADENERLVRAVFAELAASNPGKLQYASFRLDDGVSFLHVAVVDGDVNPLNSSPAFSDFQADLKERCAAPPNPVRASVIGSYGFGIE